MMGLVSKAGGALASLLRGVANSQPLRERAQLASQASASTQPFGPGTAIEPSQARGIEPRRWIYPPAINVASGPRAMPGQVSFQDLRNFAASYDVLRVCVETRKQQMRGLKWDVVVRNHAASRGSDFSADIERAVAFFAHPDGRMPFGTWLGAALEDALVIDALTIYKRRDRAGRLLALELVDGATIKPLIDEYGRPPAPPAAAYQQFAYGFPWANFGGDEILYRPYNPRSFANYGYSPVEQIVVTVTLALSRQIAAISYYKEGNTPAGFGEVPKEWTSAMIREFEEIFNGLLAGDFAARSRIKMVPAGFNFKPWVDSSTTFNTAFDEYLTRIACAAFGVPPTQFLKTYNRATAEVVDEASTVAGFDPLKEFIERLCDEILLAGDGLNMPHLRFTFTSERRSGEELELKKNVEYLKAGVLSIDDVLVRLGMEPIGVGRFVTVPGQGIVPLETALAGSKTQRPGDTVGQRVAMNEKERADLGKWMRKARRAIAKRISDGGPTDGLEVEFESEAIESGRAAAIEAGLKGVRTAADVEALFASTTEADGLAAMADGPTGPERRHPNIAHAWVGLTPMLKRLGGHMTETVLTRAGIWKEGFGEMRVLPWLHDRGPAPHDLRRRVAEYFDSDDFDRLHELSEILIDAASMPSLLSAGFPRVSRKWGTETQSLRPGALPPSQCVSDGEPDELIERAVSAVLSKHVLTTRARLNRLIDTAHERGFTRSELRDAALRASDFGIEAARTLVNELAAALRAGHEGGQVQELSSELR